MVDRPWDDTFEALILAALREQPSGGVLFADTALRDHGLDSQRTVGLLLALESEFGFEFPDDAMSFATFATPASLWQVVEALLGAGVGGRTAVAE